jgi:nucleoside-diphosphate-sugar epimerase
MGYDLAPILVTGASGYLGRRVINALCLARVPHVATSRRGVVGDACDLTDASAVKHLMTHHRPSAVIHCAAIVPSCPADYCDESMAHTTVTIARHVFDNARCRVVLASSMTVYGGSPDVPVGEDAPCAPAAGYARGKWLVEQALFEHGAQGDVALRLPGLFGLPRRTGLLYKAARAFLDSDRFECTIADVPWAAITVDDAAAYLARAAILPLGAPPQVVNVGYRGEYSAIDAVAHVAKCCGIAWVPPTLRSRTFSMDLSRLESLYGGPPASLRQRLETFVDSIRRDRQRLGAEEGIPRRDDAT